MFGLRTWPRWIGFGRAIFGLLILISPATAERLFGLRPAGFGPDATLVTRFTGNRELLLGLALAVAPAEHSAALLGLCTAADAADALVSACSVRAGLPLKATAQNVGAASALAALELWTLRRLRRTG